MVVSDLERGTAGGAGKEDDGVDGGETTTTTGVQTPSELSAPGSDVAVGVNKEKAVGSSSSDDEDSVAKGSSSVSFVFHKVMRMGRVEEGGIAPLPVEKRQSRRYFNIFTVWFSMNFSILPLTFGLLGPSSYGLSLRDSCLVILFFTLLSTFAPAYLSTLGPKTGMRQMIQARFSFGRYLVGVPVLLNLATLTGFIVVLCVVGGQCLSAVSSNGLTPDAGIVIIGILGMLISFCGFKVLHYYEGFAFIPALIVLCVVTGTGGDGLKKQATVPEPPTAGAILSFGMIIASNMIPWAAIASDLTTYFDPNVPSWRVFTYAYAGLALPTVPLMVLGAAIGNAIPNNPSWQAGYDAHQVGGVLGAMLESAGGFGKFCLVILSLTLLGNTAGTMYAISLNFQTLIPWLFRVPRYVFSVVITAVAIPVSIRAATDFFDNVENFLGLIGYWAAAFVGIVLVEHLYFRGGRYDAYDPEIWDDGGKLPWGAAALASGVGCFGLVIPCMEQIWWTGPIAQTTGDIGFEMAFVLAGLLYLPLRSLEKRYSGR